MTLNMNPGTNDIFIELPIFVHLIDEPKNQFTTIRTKNTIPEFFRQVNNIWTSAQIRFNPVSIQREVIEITQIKQLINSQDIENPPKDPNLIDLYFLLDVQFPHQITRGFTIRKTKRVFVTDELYGVDDSICIAHEFGHVLELDHVTQFDRLMEGRGNGKNIIPSEIKTARDAALNFKTYYS